MAKRNKEETREKDLDPRHIPVVTNKEEQAKRVQEFINEVIPICKRYNLWFNPNVVVSEEGVGCITIRSELRIAPKVVNQ